ncbi:deoxyribonuclease-1-like [Haliotis cracherodii]|uniref:deoxyribonuclease-1-like n=1 Tax=Haliotis cracherodii TaxID=6455 RepID=UPI0039EAD6ED
MATSRRGTKRLAALEDDSIPALAAPPLRVAAFNIQVFGRKKMKNKNVTSIISKVVHRYDLVLLQEIRDKGKTALDNLLTMLNKVDPDDPFVADVSERLGRTVSKEQYAFLYRPSRVQIVGSYQYEDGVDDGTDSFEREPYAVRFTCPNLEIDDFAIIAIHTSPSKAVAEINALVHVWEATKKHWGIENIIIAGDFNADGDFVSGSDWERISLRSDRRFTWLIKDNADTTVSSTDCSYDRFVVTGHQLKTNIVPGSCKVFRFDTEFSLSQEEAEDVSDHYPIELSIAGKKNTKLQKMLNTELSFNIAQMQNISSVSHVRALYRTKKAKGAGFTIERKRDGDRKTLLEVIAVKEHESDVVTSLQKFQKLFPEVLFTESIGMAKAYMDSGMFDKPPYVYGLCTVESKKSYDVTITCRLRAPLTCHVKVTNRRS